MSETKHTPTLRAQTGGKAILDEHGHPFAVCRSPEDAVRVAAMLNAHADLLAACEAFVTADNQDGITLAYNMARAAIAKATCAAGGE